MIVDDTQRTAKARQVRTEKRTVDDVLRALEDLVNNDLALEPSKATPGTDTPELWDAEIPVLRDVVIHAPVPEGSARPDPRQVRDMVHRAIATFNGRLQPEQRLGATAIDLLEHLLFEEWVRTSATLLHPESHHE